MGSTRGPLAVLLLCCIISTAADCNYSRAPFQTADLATLAAIVAVNNFSPQLDDPLILGMEMSTTPATNITFGSVQLCFRKPALSAWVALTDIALAANDVLSKCCSNVANCQGGDELSHGVNGINVSVRIENVGVGC